MAEVVSIEAGWVVVNNNRNYVRYIDPKTGKYVKNTNQMDQWYAVQI